MESDNIRFPANQLPLVQSPTIESTKEGFSRSQQSTSNITNTSLTILANTFNNQNIQPLIGRPVKNLSERKKEAVDKIYNEEVLKLKTSDLKEQSKLKVKIESEILKLSKKTNPTHVFKLNEEEYTVSKIQNSHQKTVGIKISQLGKFLGEGNYGKVNTLNSSLVGISQNAKESDIASANIKQVVKQPLSDDEVEIADMKNDAKITAHLNLNGPKVGIPSPSHFITYGSSARLILEGFHFDGESFAAGRKLIEPSQMSPLLSQIWQGIDNIHEMGVYHGDIKPENLMFSQNESGELKAVFIDYGGSTIFDEKFNGEKFPEEIFGVFTSDYLSEELSERIYDLKNKFENEFNNAKTDTDKTEIIKNMKKEMIPLMKLNDRYATGVALYEMITSGSPERFWDDEAGQLLFEVEFMDKELFKKGLLDPSERLQIINAVSLK